MKDIVTVEIDAPIGKVVELFGDPSNMTAWMGDVQYEPIGEVSGAPGAKYRLLSKSGGLDFTATVLSRDLPAESTLLLEAPSLDVSVNTRFVELPFDRTQLVSEEEFRFKGLVHKSLGLLSRPAMRKAHRRHMEGFKRFAERSGRAS